MSDVRDNARLYFFGALGGVLFGYDTGVISGAILFISKEFHTTPFLKGAVVASLLLGAMVGAGLAGRLADRLGRRRLIIGAAVLFSVGAVGSALSQGVWVLIAFRFVIGIGVGAAALIVPLYLSEVAPAHVRGAITSLNQLMIVTGILVAFLVDAALASSGEWRWMLGLAVIPSLVLLVGMITMPETPRWLAMHGRDDEARRILCRLRARDDDTVDEELREMSKIEEEEGGLRKLTERWLRPALVVAIGLAMFQQLIGINTIIYFAPTTLTNVGYGADAAIYANIVIGVLNLAMTLVAIRLIDRVGRKPLLIAGLVGVITSLTVLGVCLEALPEAKKPGDPAAIVTLVCLAGYIVSFAATWGPVVWVMLPEVLPLSIRGTAMGVAIFLHWGCNFAVSQSFPVLTDAFKPGPVFLGYAVIAVLALIFVRLKVPETKGKSLEEIEGGLAEAETATA
jgi:SP family sugar:H+ symporter-like MFS transporter